MYEPQNTLGPEEVWWCMYATIWCVWPWLPVESFASTQNL